MGPALILIDIQTGFDDPVWGERNNADAEEKAGELLAHWRAAGWPIAHIRHLSTEPGSPLAPGTGGAEFKPQVTPRPGEPIFEKSVNSAFIATGLEAHLRAAGITDLVICGLTTPHCVSTSARMAANLGFRVRLAHDACASFSANADTTWLPEQPAMTPAAIHESALNHLHGEFAEVLSSAEIIGAVQ